MLMCFNVFAPVWERLCDFCFLPNVACFFYLVKIFCPSRFTFSMILALLRCTPVVLFGHTLSSQGPKSCSATETTVHVMKKTTKKLWQSGVFSLEQEETPFVCGFFFFFLAPFSAPYRDFGLVFFFFFFKAGCLCKAVSWEGRRSRGRVYQPVVKLSQM